MARVDQHVLIERKMHEFSFPFNSIRPINLIESKLLITEALPSIGNSSDNPNQCLVIGGISLNHCATSAILNLLT